MTPMRLPVAGVALVSIPRNFHGKRTGFVKLNTHDNTPVDRPSGAHGTGYRDTSGEGIEGGVDALEPRQGAELSTHPESQQITVPTAARRKGISPWALGRFGLAPSGRQGRRVHFASQPLGATPAERCLGRVKEDFSIRAQIRKKSFSVT